MTVRRILGCHLAKFTHLLILSLMFCTQCYNLCCLSPCQSMARGTEGSTLCMSPEEPGDPSYFHTGFPLDQSLPGQSSHMEGPSSQNPNSNYYGICGTKQNIVLISKPGLLRKAKEGINERRNTAFASIQIRMCGPQRAKPVLSGSEHSVLQMFPIFPSFCICMRQTEWRKHQKRREGPSPEGRWCG